jgi:hypothetical protein
MKKGHLYMSLLMELTELRDGFRYNHVAPNGALAISTSAF